MGEASGVKWGASNQDPRPGALRNTIKFPFPCLRWLRHILRFPFQALGPPGPTPHSPSPDKMDTLLGELYSLVKPAKAQETEPGRERRRRRWGQAPRPLFLRLSLLSTPTESSERTPPIFSCFQAGNRGARERGREGEREREGRRKREGGKEKERGREGEREREGRREKEGGREKEREEEGKREGWGGARTAGVKYFCNFCPEDFISLFLRGRSQSAREPGHLRLLRQGCQAERMLAPFELGEI